MTGGSISNNTFKHGNTGYAAAVLVRSNNKEKLEKNSVFNMSGGKISNNKGGSYGGVLVGWAKNNDFVWYSEASMVMNGGEISNNEASYLGGGIAVSGTADVKIKGGLISGNISPFGGGIGVYDYFKNGYDSVTGNDIDKWHGYSTTKLTVNGGEISNNKALNLGGIENIAAEPSTGVGGGIYVASDNVVINGGEIINNHADKQGGGVYVSSTPYVLKMNNVLATDNSATNIGGGLWLCPTGDAETFVNNGAAIFGNKATKAGDDVASLSSDANEKLTLSNVLLGGHVGHYYKDGEISTEGEYALLGNGTSENRFKNSDENAYTTNDLGYIKSSNETLALKTVIAKEGSEAAKKAAKVFITGNTSSRGGGIGSNGAIIFGSDDGEVKRVNMKVSKEWKNLDKNSAPGKVLVELVQTNDSTREERIIDTIILGKENNWSFEWKDLIKKIKLDGVDTTYSYSVREKDTTDKKVVIDGKTFVVEISGSESEGYKLSNTPDKIDSKTIDVEVKKTWENINPDSLDIEIKVWLVKNNQVTDKFVVLNKDNNWSAKFTNLLVKDDGKDEKNSYSFKEDGENNGIIFIRGMEFKVDYSSNEIRNTYLPPYTPPFNPGNEYIRIKGEKIWVGDSQDSRPEYIVVRLINEAKGKVEKEIIVSKDTNWTYDFGDLLKFDGSNSFSYRVEEVVPNGYKVKYDGYNIINIKESDEPKEPYKPGKVEEPTPQKSDEPSKPEESQDKEIDYIYDNPKTLVEGYTPHAIAILISGASIALADYKRRKNK